MRVYIFGASGSGTSTLGRELQKHGFRWLDTDDFYWMPTDPPYTEARDKNERIRLLTNELTVDGNIVLSGSVTGGSMWGLPLLPLFDLAVFIYTPPEERIKRLREREYEEFGSRIFKGGDMYEIHEEFIAWAAGYDTQEAFEQNERSLGLDEKLMQDVIKCPILRLDGMSAVEENAKLVIERLSTL